MPLALRRAAALAVERLPLALSQRTVPDEASALGAPDVLARPPRLPWWNNAR